MPTYFTYFTYLVYLLYLTYFTYLFGIDFTGQVGSPYNQQVTANNG